MIMLFEFGITSGITRVYSVKRSVPKNNMPAIRLIYDTLSSSGIEISG